MGNTTGFRAHMGAEGRAPPRRGGAPVALLGSARSLLDLDDPEDVGLRKIARRTGVSAAAAYKHFADKDDLMAAVAATGFQELGAAMGRAAAAADPPLATGLAYVEFARANRGLFRLMFGPLLAARDQHPELGRAAAETFRSLGRLLGEGHGATAPTVRAPGWRAAFVHGAACLAVANVLSAAEVRDLVRTRLERRAPVG